MLSSEQVHGTSSPSPPHCREQSTSQCSAAEEQKPQLQHRVEMAVEEVEGITEPAGLERARGLNVQAVLQSLPCPY